MLLDENKRLRLIFDASPEAPQGDHYAPFPTKITRTDKISIVLNGLSNYFVIRIIISISLEYDHRGVCASAYLKKRLLFGRQIQFICV